MGHNRRLAFSGAAMTNARLRGNKTFVAAEIVRDELEDELVASEYFVDAPFANVGISIRYGLKYDSEPLYWKIDRAHQELPLAIEVDVNDMLNSDQEGMNAIFRKAALIALIHAGQKYHLKTARLEALLEQS
jgi:Immunity protein 39